MYACMHVCVYVCVCVCVCVCMYVCMYVHVQTNTHTRTHAPPSQPTPPPTHTSAAPTRTTPGSLPLVRRSPPLSSCACAPCVCVWGGRCVAVRRRWCSSSPTPRRTWAAVCIKHVTCGYAVCSVLLLPFVYGSAYHLPYCLSSKLLVWCNVVGRYGLGHGAGLR
jgi:hypothetical protein